MKMYGVVFSLLFCGSGTFAQEWITRSNFWYLIDVQESNERAKANKQKKYKQVVITSTDKHRDDVTKCQYDTLGRVVQYSWEKRQATFRYTDSSQLALTRRYKKGKLLSKDSTYWNDGKIYSRHYFKKEREITRHHYKYDSSAVIYSSVEKQRRGRWIELSRQEYEYNPDRSLKKVTYYRKGKPKQFSVFDCNPIGENHKIQRDSTYNCVKFETDSLGNKVKVSVANHRRGSYKTVAYYNDKEQLIARKVYNAKKDRLITAIVFRPGSLWLHTDYIWYTRNGKELHRTKAMYDNDDHLLSRNRYKRGKLREKMINQYSGKGDLIKSESFNRRNKLSEQSVYFYEFYE